MNAKCGAKVKILTFIASLLLMLVPVAAFAFGPVAHVDMALEVLSSASMIGGAIAAVISRHRKQFILGTLDPDRTLAKNLAPYEKHSHNWENTIAEFNAAGSDEEKARSLGRICHLAADTVAHNYFIPMKIVDSYRNRTAGHFFWELRFDARLRDMKGQDELSSMEFNGPEEIEYLRTIIKPTVASRGINARLTGVAMSIQKAISYTSATSSIDRRSSLLFTDDEMLDIRSLAVKAQIAALSDMASGVGLAAASGTSAGSGIFDLDPRGISCIKASRKIRRELKITGRQGVTPSWTVDTQMKHHKDCRDMVVSVLGE